MKKRNIWAAVAILAFSAAAACILLVWRTEREKERTNALYQEMRQNMKLDEEEAEGQSQTEQAESADEEIRKTDLVIPVDFEALQDINPDIYAWITVPGTEIDYPVLQSETDDTVYLTNSAELEESPAGAIFSEKANARDFSDVHTVLYGHNMKDGTMFAGLHQYEDEAFFNEHRTITIYTPDAIRYYRIFAAYLYDNRHLLQSFDCTDERVFSAYIYNIMSQRNLYATIDDSVDIEADDRILTLSTCYGTDHDTRYLVQAVLVKELEYQCMETILMIVQYPSVFLNRNSFFLHTVCGPKYNPRKWRKVL